MKKSNVSFENLLDQLSEEKINRVVDRSALRAGGLELLFPPSGGGDQGSCTGSAHTKTHSSTTSSGGNGGGGGGIFGVCL